MVLTFRVIKSRYFPYTNLNCLGLFPNQDEVKENKELKICFILYLAHFQKQIFSLCSANFNLFKQDYSFQRQGSWGGRFCFFQLMERKEKYCYYSWSGRCWQSLYFDQIKPKCSISVLLESFLHQTVWTFFKKKKEA